MVRTRSRKYFPSFSVVVRTRVCDPVAIAQKKISVALHPDIAADLARSARMQDLSVSAWIEQAARAKLRNEAGMAACDEFEREYGAFTPKEIAKADAILDKHFGPVPDQS